MQWEILINEGGAVNLVGKEGDIEIEIIANIRRSASIIYLEELHFRRITVANWA